MIHTCNMKWTIKMDGCTVVRCVRGVLIMSWSSFIGMNFLGTSFMNVLCLNVMFVLECYGVLMQKAKGGYCKSCHFGIGIPIGKMRCLYFI